MFTPAGAWPGDPYGRICWLPRSRNLHVCPRLWQTPVQLQRGDQVRAQSKNWFSLASESWPTPFCTMRALLAPAFLLAISTLVPSAHSFVQPLTSSIRIKSGLSTACHSRAARLRYVCLCARCQCLLERVKGHFCIHCYHPTLRRMARSRE